MLLVMGRAWLLTQSPGGSVRMKARIGGGGGIKFCILTAPNNESASGLLLGDAINTEIVGML